MASSPEKPDQDALFTVEAKGNGSTDPGNFAVDHHFVVPEDGDHAEQPTQEDLLAPEDTAAAQLISEAIKTQQRRAVQLGKHSPVAQGREPTDLQPGDFVPGFGPVTYRNIEAARVWRLNTEHNRRRTA